MWGDGGSNPASHPMECVARELICAAERQTATTPGLLMALEGHERSGSTQKWDLRDFLLPFKGGREEAREGRSKPRRQQTASKFVFSRFRKNRRLRLLPLFLERLYAGKGSTFPAKIGSFRSLTQLLIQRRKDNCRSCTGALRAREHGV